METTKGFRDYIGVIQYYLGYTFILDVMQRWMPSVVTHVLVPYRTAVCHTAF